MYVKILHHFRYAVKRKHPEKWEQNSWFLLHKNKTPAHQLLVVREYFTKQKRDRLVTNWLFLFLRLKSVLKQRFTSADKATTKVMTTLTQVSKNGFQECFQKLYKCWQKHVTAKENYFEGNVE
jgi:hypothetical protein